MRRFRDLAFWIWLARALFAIPHTPARPVLGDADQDPDLDLVGFARFSSCFSGEFLAGA